MAGTLGNGISKGSWSSGGTGGGNGSLTDADIVDPVHGIAFAVYSEDDHSLMFYRQPLGPQDVSVTMLNSRRVTASVIRGSKMDTPPRPWETTARRLPPGGLTEVISWP